MTSIEREENAYTFGVQAGLWGYPLASRVEAFYRALAVKGIGHISFPSSSGSRQPRTASSSPRTI